MFQSIDTESKICDVYRDEAEVEPVWQSGDQPESCNSSRNSLHRFAAKTGEKSEVKASFGTAVVNLTSQSMFAHGGQLVQRET